MPHYSESSAAWQAAVEASVGVRMLSRVVFDPDGRNIDLKLYLANAGACLQECDAIDSSYRGREIVLTLSAMGTDKLNRFNSSGILYGWGWYNAPVAVYAKLKGPSGWAEEKIFTGFLRSPAETKGGAAWSLVDQFARLREMRLTNINQISEIKADYSDPQDPSNVQTDSTKVTIADQTISKLEKWTVVFDKHPSATTDETDPEYEEYESGKYYVKGSVTGIDTTLGSEPSKDADHTTDSGILTLAADFVTGTPDRGDRYTFLTTVIVGGDRTPAGALKWILQDHTDLEDKYIDTSSMDALDSILAPASISWTIDQDYSILRITEILAQHGLMFVFPDADGAMRVKLFAPEYNESLPQISKDVDLKAYEADEDTPIYNVIEVHYNYNWQTGEYESTYTYPDDCPTLADNTGHKNPDPPDGDGEHVLPGTFSLGNASADLHGVERKLVLDLLGFTSANEAWLRFLCGWIYARYAYGVEVGWAYVLEHGLTVLPGERYELVSRHPERDAESLVVGTHKNPDKRDVRVRLLRMENFNAVDWCFCDLGHKCDTGKKVW